MHLFFRLIDEAGIRHKAVADRIGVSGAQFHRVRSGERRASERFRALGTAEIARIGIRHPDGRAYSEAELFAPVASLDGTNTDLPISSAVA